MNPKTVFERVKEVAEKKGGKCISVTYFKYGAKLKFECQFGHIWESSYDSITRGSWCPHCRKK